MHYYCYVSFVGSYLTCHNYYECADSDSGSSSGSESDAEEAQTAGAGPKASHDKV